MDEREKIEELLFLLEQELAFSFSRSSGPGGQHANKVNTRVELRFSVNGSEVLSGDQKAKIMKRLANRITSEGLLIVSAQDERSQLRNKQLAVARFRDLIAASLRPSKRRIPTAPPPGSEEKRLGEKRKTAEKKQSRKSPDAGES